MRISEADVRVFISKSILLDMNIATPAFFWFPLHGLLFPSLTLVCECPQVWSGSPVDNIYAGLAFESIHSATLCLLVDLTSHWKLSEECYDSDFSLKESLLFMGFTSRKLTKFSKWKYKKTTLGFREQREKINHFEVFPK